MVKTGLARKRSGKLFKGVDGTANREMFVAGSSEKRFVMTTQVIDGFKLVSRIKVPDGEAFEWNQRVAREAGAPPPNFVEWAKPYPVESGLIRFVSEMVSNGRTFELDDDGRKVHLPSGETFHDMVAYAERWEPLP